MNNTQNNLNLSEIQFKNKLPTTPKLSDIQSQDTNIKKDFFSIKNHSNDEATISNSNWHNNNHNFNLNSQHMTTIQRLK